MTRVIEYVGMTAAPAQDTRDAVIEDLRIRGYSILENVLSNDECRAWAEKLDRLNAMQNGQYGIERLASNRTASITRPRSTATSRRTSSRTRCSR